MTEEFTRQFEEWLNGQSDEFKEKYCNDPEFRDKILAKLLNFLGYF